MYVSNVFKITSDCTVTESKELVRRCDQVVITDQALV